MLLTTPSGNQGILEGHILCDKHWNFKKTTDNFDVDFIEWLCRRHLHSRGNTQGPIAEATTIRHLEERGERPMPGRRMSSKSREWREVEWSAMRRRGQLTVSTGMLVEVQST